MDGEGLGGEEGGEAVEEENTPDESVAPEEADLLQEIVAVIESAAQLGDYRRTQRKECYNLVRRLKLLLPLIEEIRDHDELISETGVESLWNLKKAINLAKKLLKICNEGSKIYLVRQTLIAYILEAGRQYTNRIPGLLSYEIAHLVSGIGERGS